MATVRNQSLNIHHLISRQIGGDRPDNLITLCNECHQKYHQEPFGLKIPKSIGFAAETFMTMVRWRLVNETEANYTYGYLTKSKRIELGLPKSHINDAFVIANATNQNRTRSYSIKLVRKCNRKLFKGKRSEIKNKCPRIIFGFRLFDKVKYNGITCFIFGRRTSGRFDLRTIDSKSVSKSANYKKLNLIETSKTMLISFYPVD